MPTMGAAEALSQSGGADGDDRSALSHADRVGRALLLLVLAVAITGVLLPAAMLPQFWRVVLVKMALVVLLSMVPGWLYLEFVSQRGQGLYDEYVLNLFRLHIDEYRNLPAPPQHTSYYGIWRQEHEKLRTPSRDNLYRRKFESVFGPTSVSTRSLIGEPPHWHDLARTFGPVVVATLALCLGWVLTVQPELIREVAATQRALSGRPELPAQALQFGFVGAYLFIVQDLVRRYFRDDLKPGAYISALTRIIVVALLVTALHLVWGGDPSTEAVLAFLVGFFPQTGLRLVIAALARPLAQMFPRIDAEHPLHEIDGLSIWYESRLLEEGIEDVQNLVTANLVDVMLRTRVPVSRLVDWLDQAHLYLNLPGTIEKRREIRASLLTLGVRTATDLVAVWPRSRECDAYRQAISAALGVSPDLGPQTVEAILATLPGEPNFWHVQEFRQHEWLLRDHRRGIGAPEPGKAATSGNLQPAVNAS